MFLAQQEYNELKERIERPMEETQESAPLLAPPAVSNLADVPVDSKEHDPDMDLNNPGIEEEDDGVAPSVKRKRLDYFDQMVAGLNHFDDEMLASFLGHVQAHSEKQNAVVHEVAVSSCGMLVGMESPPRAWIVRLMPTLLSGSGTRKTSFFKPQSKLGENFQFSGQDGQNRSPPPFSGPEGFQEKLRTSSHRPSFH